MPNLLREYMRELISETNFPLEGGDKMRIHHSREGSRSGSEPQITGFSQKIGPKPNGLWYECQDGSSETWKEFCTLGMSKGYQYDSTYNVMLNDYEILFIPDEHHFEKFYKMYSTYLSNKRMDDDSFWYYGWDVASGCVWDPSGVKEIIQAGDCGEPST